MISQNDLSKMFQIISDDEQSFEAISVSLKESFTRAELFNLCLSLCVLLKDDILNISQRIICYYILYEMKKNEKIEVTPFLPLILEFLQFSQNKTEQSFLIDLINEEINYTKYTVKNYVEDHTNSSEKLNIDYIQKLKKRYLCLLNNFNFNNNNGLMSARINLTKNDIFSENPLNLNDQIRNVIYDKKKNDIKMVENNQPFDLNYVNININEELSYKFFNSNYMSFCPFSLNNYEILNCTSNNSINNIKENINLNKIFDNEPFWLMPKLKHNFIWEKENEKDK